MEKASEQVILNIIAEALEVDQVGLDSSADNIEAWDSLGHLSVLANLDKALDGKIAGIQEIASAISVKDVIHILKKHSLIE